MMTGGAIELRMLRYVCLHLPVHIGMAHVTAFLQGSAGRDLHWSVRISMTFGTLCQVRSVYQLVTCRTLREDIFIFYPARAIDVEFYMALLTVYPVLTALGLYKVIKAWMTPPTLFRFDGLSLNGIRRWNFFFGNRLRRSWCWCHTPDKSEAQADYPDRKYDR